ncbi:MAG: tetratricopeptide repeat protein [Deltaproteobacteria bacterium]|nr:tetratricopeptide repeat protein [Deltaproteobacteria bacterium]
MSYFDQAIRENPEFGAAYHDRGVAYQKMGEMEKAIRDFDEAIRISDQNVSAYYNRGVCYTITRVYKRAIADFQKVIELAPEDPRAYNNLAWIYAVSNVKKFRNPELAVENARKAVELTKGGYAAYVDTLAESYYAAGDIENAQVWAEKAISLEPQNKTYKDHLERFRKPPEQ